MERGFATIRQRKEERRALTRLRFTSDGATVPFDNLLAGR
jgi:hypothetical protein